MLMGGPRKRPVRRHQRYGKRELSILAMATATVAAFYALSVQNGWAAEKKGTGTIKDVANAEIKLSKANATEDQERQVDQVALHSQEQAIAKLNQLFKKYTGTSKEPVFLSKLADLQQQHATILFRIAHSKSHRSKKTLDLAPYHKMLNQSISSLDRLIAKYPGFEEIPHAYFLRGKAYEELGKKPEAGKNYLHLVHNYPNADESTSAYMSLAEFAIEANDHARAVTFLKEVEKRPEDPHFPFALYKLAWAHYNLKKIPEALSYAERQIKFYNDRKSRDETSSLSNSDLALKENTLLDSAVFYFEGYEEKLPQYSNDMALSYFRNLEEGPILGKMLLRYAKLLRSHSHEADLTSWKNQVLSSASDRP